MVGSLEMVTDNELEKKPQCQYFVVRKKRLCRMTVRPGKQYCGEHEPDPKTDDGQNDNRIPCPNDPKHTCYVSKLQKHLAICNARPEEAPPYIVHNINAPPDDNPQIRISLNEVPKEKLSALLEKINKLYDEQIKDNIQILEDQEIHPAVLEDFQTAGRTETSRRHLRQVSGLLRLAERARLVRPDTCYVELGAGKGQLSYYLWGAWGAQGRGRALLVDRAALRHKRDNRLRTAETDCPVSRVRADLAHLYLRPLLEEGENEAKITRVVGLAKHLCGVATDYALRCVTREEMGGGLVLAACCHHRCSRQLLGYHHLQKMGIDDEEFEIMLRVVSWATCGDGRPRTRRPPPGDGSLDSKSESGNGENEPSKEHEDHESENLSRDLELVVEERQEVGRRAKAVVEWARVLALRERRFEARLWQFVPRTVTPENICIVATREPPTDPTPKLPST